jgi:hypothetical protein
MRRYDSNLENAVRVVSVNEQRRLRPGSIWRQAWFTGRALDGVIEPINWVAGVKHAPTSPHGPLAFVHRSNQLPSKRLRA